MSRPALLRIERPEGGLAFHGFGLATLPTGATKILEYRALPSGPMTAAKDAAVQTAVAQIRADAERDQAVTIGEHVIMFTSVEWVEPDDPRLALHASGTPDA